jgi:hypothetical protein
MTFTLSLSFLCDITATTTTTKIWKFFLLIIEVTFKAFLKVKSQKKPQNRRNQGFSYYFRLMIQEAQKHTDPDLDIQGGSVKSGIFFFLLSNDTAQLKIIRFD